MSNRIAALTFTQRKMIACSLEIDGRVDRAAEAVVGGHVSELTYVPNEAKTAYVPQSPKAIELEELKAELEAEIARVGVDALIEELRTLRRPVTPITEDVKAQGGRDAYSVQIPCPSCDLTGRSGAQSCARCAGAGHMWTKPAKPTEAEKAEAAAKLEAEAKIAAGHRADALAIRRTAAERRAIMAAEAAAHEAATGEQAARDAADAKQAEADAELWDTIAAENDAAVEKQVAEFAAKLEALTAPKPENDARVFPLRQAEASGRADLVVMLCDSCFSVKARVAGCFRCEGHGLVWLTPAALEAKAASVAERRAAPVTDPADLDDDAPTPDRARVWDEAVAACLKAGRAPLNPYYSAPVAE